MHTHNEANTEGFYRCKRCWLKLLTLTALTLKEMKKSRGIEEGYKSQKAQRRRRNKKRRERRGKGRIKARILSILPLPLLSVFIFALRLRQQSISDCSQSFSLSGRPWLRPNVICFLIFIIHLANKCFALLIKEQTMDVCPSLFLSHTHTHNRCGRCFHISQ